MNTPPWVWLFPRTSHRTTYVHLPVYYTRNATAKDTDEHPDEERQRVRPEGPQPWALLSTGSGTHQPPGTPVSPCRNSVFAAILRRLHYMG